MEVRFLSPRRDEYEANWNMRLSWGQEFAGSIPLTSTMLVRPRIVAVELSDVAGSGASTRVTWLARDRGRANAER